MSKQKFNVGDRVVINKKYNKELHSIIGAGTITSLRYSRNGKNKYTVKWDDRKLSKEYYSYELNKCADCVDTNGADTKLNIGDKVTIHEDGLQVTATKTSGVFEIIEILDTAVGGAVRGLFRR